MSLFQRATLRVPGQSYPADATVHATIPCKSCSIAVPPYVPQITSKSCWAAATTMLVSAHDSVTYTIDAVLQKAAAKAVGDLPPAAPTIQDLRYYLNHGMPNSGGQFPNFLGQLGISLLPASLTPAAICALLSNHGPIGANIDVGVDPDLDDGETASHDIVIYGIDYDEFTGCQVMYHDPGRGSSGAESYMPFTKFDTLYGAQASAQVHIFYYP
jgi:hypothetical protein